MNTTKSKRTPKSDAASPGKKSAHKIPDDLEGLGLPWRLCFERDGTEDIGIICESDGTLSEIATSRMFWLPEYKHDPIPGTLKAFRLMVAAPKLFDALRGLLDSMPSTKLSKGQKTARNKALAAIAEASSKRKPRSVSHD